MGLVNPASGDGDGETGTGADVEGRNLQVNIWGVNSGGARGGYTLHPSCVVSTGEDGYVYNYTKVNLGGEVISTTSIRDGQGDDDVSSAFEQEVQEGVDSDDVETNSSRNDQEEIGQIIDGEINIDGSSFNVWVISDCTDDDSPFDQIVIAPPAAAGLLPFAPQIMEDLLPEPELELLPFDEENEWTYVQAPIDFRTTAQSLEPITLTLDTGGPETNGDGQRIRQWITMTATPQRVIFDSGDPLAEEPTVECTPEEATAPYVPEVPGACSYQFRNSSSIVDGGQFETELTVEWQVTYTSSDSGDGAIPVDPVVQEEPVAVAEVKAVNVYG